MKKLWIALTALTALGAGAAGPALASNPGELTVHDGGKLFSAEGIKAAKAAFAAESFDSPTRMTVATFDGLPDKKKAAFAALTDKAEKDAFAGTWARDEAKADGAKGIFVLISSNPNYVRVIADEQMRIDRKFGDAKVGRVQDVLIDSFKAAKDLTGDASKKTHDAGLLKAIDYSREQLKGTSAVSATASKTTAGTTRAEKGGTGMSLLGWVCIIGVVLLGVWLVIGLFRAVTGMGGGGGGGYGPGGGYGGGGGGFMSSLMGGMFGTMAGMWMYNSFMGGGMSNMSAGDYGGSGGGDLGGGGGDLGGEAGNFDNGADAGGGDWGGGGDAGGGGGDFGGGDFGGGDFGGGGGDFGGGGGGDW